MNRDSKGRFKPKQTTVKFRSRMKRAEFISHIKDAFLVGLERANIKDTNQNKLNGYLKQNGLLE